MRFVFIWKRKQPRGFKLVQERCATKKMGVTVIAHRITDLLFRISWHRVHAPKFFEFDLAFKVI